MKKYTLIFLCLFIIMINCKAQKKDNVRENQKRKTMIIPNRDIKNIVVPNLEQIDSQSQKNDSIETKSLLGENIKLKRVEKKLVSKSNYSFEEYDSKGLIKKVLIENSKVHSIEEIYRDQTNVITINKEWTNFIDKPINIDVNYIYTFYDTGELKKIKIYSNNVPVGNWYLYDQSGNEILHIDIEKYFKMSLLQVLERASKIDVDNRPNYSISRLFDAKNSYWRLEYSDLNDEGGGIPRTILLDDSNGEIIYNELKDHEPDYRSTGVINYSAIYKYMSEIFEPFD